MSDTATTTPETHQFAAEVGRLLDLVVHSLYTEREIFLRELVANAADAMDRSWPPASAIAADCRKRCRRSSRRRTASKPMPLHWQLRPSSRWISCIRRLISATSSMAETGMVFGL